MDFSDSDECFESADEDFDSDQLESKDVSFKKNIAEKNSPKIKPKNITEENIEEKPIKISVDKLPSSKSTSETNKSSSNVKPAKNVEQDNVPNSILHKPTVCWFPEVNLPRPKNTHDISKSGSKHMDSEEDVVEMENPMPKRTDCSLPSYQNVDKINKVTRKINEELKNPKSECIITPHTTVCFSARRNQEDPIKVNINEAEDKHIEESSSKSECEVPANKHLSQNAEMDISDQNDNTDEVGRTNITDLEFRDEGCDLQDQAVNPNIKDLTNKLDNLKVDDNKYVLDSNTEIANNNEETNMSQIDKITNQNKDEVDENLWGDNEGWGYEEPDLLTNEDTDGKNINDLINLWNDDENWGETTKENDNTQSIYNTLENLSSQSDNIWGGWGTWGISSVLSTAANITSSVSQGLSNVLETGIGVPDPAELARQHKLEASLLNREADHDTIQEQNDSSNSTFGLGNFVSGVSTITKIVESTGTKVISGGLDTLETIGKKTMEVLSENDPGLKKKRAFLKIDQNKPVLSQILREAKEKVEEENRKDEKRFVKKKANYEAIFDDYQGLVHLEALEMLSRQCYIKLQSVLSNSNGEGLNELQETIALVKELCELPEDDEESHDLDNLKDKFETSISDLGFSLNFNKILESWSIIAKSDSQEAQELHDFAIENLAQLTAFAVEQFHKSGELLLVKEHRSTANEADSLVQLTVLFSSLISSSASKFADNLNDIPTSDKYEISTLITNIFLEAANSSRYIVDAFQLLIPVIQVGAIG